MDEYTVSLVFSLDRKKVLLVENEETGRLCAITSKRAKDQTLEGCAYKSIKFYTNIFVNGLVEVMTVERSLDNAWMGAFSKVHYYIGQTDPKGKFYKNVGWVSVDHLLNLPVIDDIFEDKLLPAILLNTLKILESADKAFNIPKEREHKSLEERFSSYDGDYTPTECDTGKPVREEIL